MSYIHLSILKHTLLLAIGVVFILLIIGILKKYSAQVRVSNLMEQDPTYVIVQDNISRYYKVHVPSPSNEVLRPLVIYVHGGGGNMKSAYLDGLAEMADRHDFILAIPQGLGERKFGQIRGIWNGGTWSTGSCCGDARDVDFISTMIDEIKQNFPIDSNRVYATGISNGGLMTNRLACELSDKIAAIAVVAPTAVMSPCTPSRQIPVMIIQGTEDPANPPDGSPPRSIFGSDSSSPFNMPYKRMTAYEIFEAWKKINNCTEGPVPTYKNGNASCESYHNTEQTTDVELCIVQGMGHTYPGGVQYLPARIVGPVSYDITFEQVWDFFTKHPRTK